jgi:hypothetical protein
MRQIYTVVEEILLLELLLRKASFSFAVEKPAGPM